MERAQVLRALREQRPDVREGDLPVAERGHHQQQHRTTGDPHHQRGGGDAGERLLLQQRLRARELRRAQQEPAHHRQRVPQERGGPRGNIANTAGMMAVTLPR